MMIDKSIDWIESTDHLQKSADEKKWEIISFRTVSSHPDDTYLLYCVIKNHKEEYVSYLFNAEFKSFNWGHYFYDLELAQEHMENR